MEADMVPLMSLWLPIVLSAVFVFIASTVLHMVLPLHKGDYRKLPSEDAFMEAMRKIDLPPGDYLVPCAGSPKDLSSPAFLEKMNKGPVAVMTIRPNGKPAMGGALAQWFVYSIVVGVFAGYIAGRALPTGAHYLAVFRFAGCTAFVGYSLALCQHSIWYGRNWTTTLKSMFDGLIYAMLTAGTFGWLWPR
jgi:hypothetical protein